MIFYLEPTNPNYLLAEAERIELQEPYSVNKFLKLAVLNLASLALEGASVTEKYVLEELSGITDTNEVRVPLQSAVGLKEDIDFNRDRCKNVKEQQIRDIIAHFISKGILKKSAEQ
jgi:hypothetical protein